MNDIILEASMKHPDPFKTGELAQFFTNISTNDNLYIKRGGGNNINLKVIDVISPFEIMVSRKGDQFKLMCTKDSSGQYILVASEFDGQSKKWLNFKYDDILGMGLSDKKYINKSLYLPKMGSKETLKPITDDSNDSETTNNSTEPESTSSTSMSLDSVLKSLDNKLDDIAMKAVLAYHKGVDKSKSGLSILGDSLSNLISKMKNRIEDGDKIKTNFRSLSPNMKYSHNRWITVNKIEKQYSSNTQNFSGNARELRNSLSEVLRVIKTSDILRINISSSYKFFTMVEVNSNQTTQFKSVGGGQKKLKNLSKQSGVVSIQGLYTDYTQPEVVRVGNKNSLVLPLFDSSNIIPSRRIAEIEGISSFSLEIGYNNIINDTISQLTSDISTNMGNLSDKCKLVAQYNNYSDVDNYVEDTLSMILDESKGGYIISNSSVSELNGLTLTSESIVNSFNVEDIDIATGLVLQTLEGVALGNILNLSIQTVNDDGSYDDTNSEIERLRMSDSELYGMVMQDPVLRGAIIKTPSFWEWLKHKKNGFNGQNIDTQYISKLSDMVNKRGSNLHDDGQEFVSNTFFNLILDDLGNIKATSNNINLYENMKLLVKVKSSNNKTEMYGYKTQRSKPSLRIITKSSVFDVNKNDFTVDKFTAELYDSDGKIGEVIFSRQR